MAKRKFKVGDAVEEQRNRETEEHKNRETQVKKIKKKVPITSETVHLVLNLPTEEAMIEALTKNEIEIEVDEDETKGVDSPIKSGNDKGGDSGPLAQKEKKRQFDILVKKGLLKHLKMTEEEAWNKIPEPEEGRKSYLLVCNKINIRTLMKWVVVDGKEGIVDIDLRKLRNTVKTPKTLFYWRYNIEDGRKMLGKSPDDCIEEFKKKNRIPGTAREAIHLLIYKPNILKHHYIDCSGSRYDGDDVPYLFLDGVGPRLRWASADDDDSLFGSFSFGSGT